MSVVSDNPAGHNQVMKTAFNYIPGEYLALKINYCKSRLEKLPKLRVTDIVISGKIRKCIISGHHRYFLDSPRGKELYDIFIIRENLERELAVYEAVWHSSFAFEPPADLRPHNVIRSLTVEGNKQVVLNKEYFDSLQNDANDNYKKYSNYYFDGIYYRSSNERDIAIYYTDMGIPFKYEPKVWIAGVPKPINPDFVLYIKELDTCKFHEHLGIKSSADYLRDTRIKYSNYTGAGLIPGTDILFTYDTADMPFDIRCLAAKLNSAVYSTMLCK